MAIERVGRPPRPLRRPARPAHCRARRRARGEGRSLRPRGGDGLSRVRSRRAHRARRRPLPAHAGGVRARGPALDLRLARTRASRAADAAAHPDPSGGRTIARGLDRGLASALAAALVDDARAVGRTPRALGFPARPSARARGLAPGRLARDRGARAYGRARPRRADDAPTGALRGGAARVDGRAGRRGRRLAGVAARHPRGDRDRLRPLSRVEPRGDQGSPRSGHARPRARAARSAGPGRRRAWTSRDRRLAARARSAVAATRGERARAARAVARADAAEGVARARSARPAQPRLRARVSRASRRRPRRACADCGRRRSP